VGSQIPHGDVEDLNAVVLTVRDKDTARDRVDLDSVHRQVRKRRQIHHIMGQAQLGLENPQGRSRRAEPSSAELFSSSPDERTAPLGMFER
jgi:hypothetical protein